MSSLTIVQSGWEQSGMWGMQFYYCVIRSTNHPLRCSCIFGQALTLIDQKELSSRTSLQTGCAVPDPEITFARRTCTRWRECTVPVSLPVPNRDTLFSLGRMIECAMARDARLSAGSIGDNKVRRKSCMHGTETFPRPCDYWDVIPRGGTDLLR